MKIIVNLNHNLKCWTLSDSQAELLKQEFPEHTFIIASDDVTAASEIGDADCYFGWFISDELLARAKKLKWIATGAAGLEWISTPGMLERELLLTNGGFHGKIISETVLGMMLFFERQLGQQYMTQQHELWRTDDMARTLGRLYGKTLLVVGAGNIGCAVAAKAKAFSMHTIGLKRKPAQALPEFDELYPLSDLEQWLPKADHVLLALPDVPETDNIMSRENFLLMKKGSYIYNVGRGNAVDEDALYDALTDDTLKGAGLDVFQQEPLSLESPLRKLKNVLLTPHASAIADCYIDLWFDELSVNLRRFMNNEPLRNVVSRDQVRKTLDRLRHQI